MKRSKFGIEYNNGTFILVFLDHSLRRFSLNKGLVNGKRLHDDVLHISKKPLRGELSGFLSIYQAEASCISPKVY